MSIGKTEFLSRPYTKKYNEGWEGIWGKTKKGLLVPKKVLLVPEKNSRKKG